MPAHNPPAPCVLKASRAQAQRRGHARHSALEPSSADTLLNSGTAGWNQRGERGETRPDIDLTWAAVNSLVLALGTFILRGHIERNLPEPLTSPAQLERWHASVTMLLREGLFRRAD